MHQKLTETLSKYEKIILVGGGTGGHIQPILSIAQELGNQDILWIGGKDSNEEKQAQENKIPFVSILTLKLATTKSPKILLYPIVLIQGILRTRKILQKEILASEEGQSHDSNSNGSIAVFSKGGPGSVAIGIAAWSLRIPLYIHESDTIPGRSNLLLGKLATKIFLGFESAKQYFDTKKCEVVGQILDPIFSGHCELAKQSRNEKTKIPLDRFVPRDDENKIDWKTTKPHILVICGSQGSRAIFDAIIGQFGDENPYEWIVALGKLNGSMRSDFENIQNIQALEWIDQKDIASLLRETNLAITRGSATTLAEIDVFEVPKIIIPLPSAAKNHQYWNAREYEKKGDTLLEQRNLHELRTIIYHHV